MQTTLKRPIFTHALWHQCEQVYSQNPSAYIQLQDSYQVNVNVLLLAQYLDQKAFLLSAEQWQSMLAVIEKWEDSVLMPYRKLRRIAKRHLAEDEYQKMLDVELIMERKSQQLLLQKLHLLEGKPLTSPRVNNNVNAYLGIYGLDGSSL
ncbi:MAG: TIGR02444 family protein [Shewanella sp.]|uniref:TIGR02444 family protein n=1 Tax=Shewanella sp. TaxID=50422 RepID=UPI003562BFDA